MKENRAEILTALLPAINKTRAGHDVIDLVYDDTYEEVRIVYLDGYIKTVSVACDSGAAVIRDVMKEIR